MIIYGGRYLSREELQTLGCQAVGEQSLVHDSCNLIGLERITIGSHVRIDPFVSIVCGTEGWVSFGSYIHIGSYCHVAGTAGVRFDDFAGLSQGVKVYSASDDYSGAVLTNPTVPAKYTGARRAEVHLGRHVIVGSGSVILPGVHIGDGSAVGALSLVSKSLDSWSIYAGSPVRRVGTRLRDLLELEKRLLSGEGE